ncbi:MAG: hypothetical protein ABH808_01520 [Candidatus Kuenenbacteria bacterium]
MGQEAVWVIIEDLIMECLNEEKRLLTPPAKFLNARQALNEVLNNIDINHPYYEEMKIQKYKDRLNKN